MRKTVTILCLAASLLLAAAEEPTELLQKAKSLVRRNTSDRAIPLLEEANSLWQQQGSTAPDYAESLDLEALLLRKKAFAKTGSSSNPISLDDATAAWRADAANLAERALQIREGNPDTRIEDMALALELRADTLGRLGEGAPYWKRAFPLRAQRVKEVSDLQPAIETPPPSKAPAAPPERVPLRIGGEVSAPTIATKVEPNYTDPARLGYYSGTCLLKIVVCADGVPREFALMRSLGFGLDEEAAKAVAKWRFKPGLKGGQPVAVQANIEVNFRLL